MKHYSKIVLSVVLLATLLSGCVSHVFNEPMAVSTKSSVYPYINSSVGEVSGKLSNGFFVLIPYATDPRKSWDRVLDAAAAKNCNAVADLQLRYTDGGFIWMFPPIVWVPAEAHGTAVKIQ